MFSRAWCVAEIAEAFQSGLQQHMKLYTEEGLTENEKMLRKMKIEDMKASRPEDVQHILSKIPDRAAFNARLQALLFDSIVANWKALDLHDKLMKVGKVMRQQ